MQAGRSTQRWPALGGWQEGVLRARVFAMSVRWWLCPVLLALGVLHCTEQPDAEYIPEPPAPAVLALYDAGFTTDECYTDSEPLDVPESAACSDAKFLCESES